MSQEPWNEWSYAEKLLASDQVRTMLLFGRPGTGKTYAALTFGRVENGVFSVTLTEETSAAEVRGHFILKASDSVWHDGPFVRAMRAGGRIVINEVSNAGGDVQQLLFLVLESAASAVLTLPSGETLRPAPGFHVVTTDNQPPERLPEPLRDRLTCVLEITRPHPDALANLSPVLRRAAEAGLGLDDDRRISARNWNDLEALSREFGLEAACRLVFGAERGLMLHDAIRIADGQRSRKRKGEEAR